MIENVLIEFAKEALLAPVLIWFMYQNRNQNDKLMRHVALAAWKTILSKDQAVEVAASMVKAASIDKIDFIRRRIEKNNLKNREENVKKSIKAELTRLSSVYVNSLNQYNVDGRMALGDWIATNFPMEEFLEEVYDSVFSDQPNPMKLVDIQTTMISYQNQMWEDLRVYINN